MQRRQKICVNSESAIGFSQNYRDVFWDVSSRSTILWLCLKLCLRKRCINHKTAECCLRDSKTAYDRSHLPLPPARSCICKRKPSCAVRRYSPDVGGICWKIKKYEKWKTQKPKPPETWNRTFYFWFRKKLAVLFWTRIERWIRTFEPLSIILIR